jgi:hypothetical protein
MSAAVTERDLRSPSSPSLALERLAAYTDNSHSARPAGSASAHSNGPPVLHTHRPSRVGLGAAGHEISGSSGGNSPYVDADVDIASPQLM